MCGTKGILTTKSRASNPKPFLPKQMKKTKENWPTTSTTIGKDCYNGGGGTSPYAQILTHKCVLCVHWQSNIVFK